MWLYSVAQLQIWMGNLTTWSLENPLTQRNEIGEAKELEMKVTFPPLRGECLGPRILKTNWEKRRKFTYALYVHGYKCTYIHIPSYRCWQEMPCSIEQWQKPWLFVDVEGDCTTRLYDSLLMGSGFEATSKPTYRHVPGLKSPFFRQSIHVNFVYFPGYYIKLLETTTKTFFFTSELLTTPRHFSHHIWWTFWPGPVGSLESEAYEKIRFCNSKDEKVLKEGWTQNNSNWYPPGN